MTRFASTLAATWKLTIPYFRSEQPWPGRLLLGAVIVIELSIVAIHVMINTWNSRFFNAIQDRNLDAFGAELLHFCMLAATFIMLAVYQQYLTQWLRIRWREWMTRRLLDRWLGAAAHYRMQLVGDAVDNPDQRIAEDVRLFVDRTVSLCIGFLGAVVSLASFVIILWALSAKAPLRLLGMDATIPGYLVWAALLYATVGTALAHLIGRALIGLDFQQQRFEADFRFNLVRVRENSEQIALLGGERTEQKRLLTQFDAIAGNWFAIMSRQKLLTFFTAGYNQASHIFPYLVVSPAYFAGGLALGGLTQTASAFGSVQSSLSFFINAYQQLAEWRAVIERLTGFDTALQAQTETNAPQQISREGENQSRVRVDNLTVGLPNGSHLPGALHVELSPGERVLLTGPSGTGKSTLFRAIAGIWPFASGTVRVPAGAKVMVLPQRPYVPIGSLAAAVAYPAGHEHFTAQQIGDVLVAVGLPALAVRRDGEAHWGAVLSLGEQQRLTIARAILHEPDYLFLDEATASLDEAAEGALYRLLHERLPQSAIVSIAHRSTLRAFHRRHIEIASLEMSRLKAAS